MWCSERCGSIFEDKIAANTNNKPIRQTIYDNRKNKIRRQIKPGNSKSLWDEVRMARAQDTAPNLNQMLLGAFAQHINAKVEDIKNQVDNLLKKLK
jgi:hypothetical protein